MTTELGADVTSAWAQLFSVGALWISLHCVGMCGPLLSGLDVGGAARGATLPHGIARALVYQAGKALTYATLGGAAGLLGAGVRHVFVGAGGPLALALGQGGLFRASSTSAPLSIATKRQKLSPLSRGAAELSAMVQRLAFDPRPSRAFFLGALLGFLPCMIPLWVLSLSALSGSVVHGALLMVALVVMNTPVVVGVTTLPRLLGARLGRAASVLPRVLLGVSGVWFVLVGLAGLKLIPHAHVGFTAMGRHWLIMFW